MAEKIVKCPYCKESFNRLKEDFEKIGRRYYHPECHKLQLEINKKKEAKKKEQKEKDSVLEGQRRHLIGYILKLQGADKPNGLVLKQIKDLSEQGYSYIGIESTLRYFHEIKENPIVGTGIGIVPFVYDEAKEWYTSRAKAKIHFNELQANGLDELTKKRIIKIKSKPLNIQSTRQKIDMDSIFKTEEVSE